MPNKSQIEQPKDEVEPDKRRKLNNVIKEQVINALGKPIDLRDIQIRKVWDEHYRVNVIVGADASAVSIAHSYFLVIDSVGSVISATPNITKLY